jgi:hypothetical protein
MVFSSILLVGIVAHHQQEVPARPSRIDLGWGEMQKGPDREMAKIFDSGSQWISLRVTWDDEENQELVRKLSTQFKSARHSIAQLKTFVSAYKKDPSRKSAFKLALATEMFDSPNGLVQPTYRRATGDLSLGATEFVALVTSLKSTISAEELNVVLRLHCQFCWNPTLWLQMAQKLRAKNRLQTSTLCAVAQRVFLAYELQGQTEGVLQYSEFIADAEKTMKQSRVRFAYGNSLIAKGRLLKDPKLFDKGAQVLRDVRVTLLDSRDPYDFWYVKADPQFETILASRRRQWFP